MQSARSIRLQISLLMQETCPLPVYYGFDYLPDLLRLRAAGSAFVFMDHAYFNRGYENGNFRVLLGEIHQTGVTRGLQGKTPPIKDWKQGSKVYVIPIAPNCAIWHDAEHWTTETVSAIRKFTDREVIVKPKNGIPMGRLLHDAWGVVAHSSVAAVEAAQNGVPVFGPETSPGFPVSAPIEDIEKPVFPDREDWLKTLAHSQFTLDEIRSGKAWATLEEGL